MQSTSLFKRKRNRVPINFLSKWQVSTKRSRITKKVVEVSLHERNTTNASNSWDNDDNNMETSDAQCYQEDDISTPVSAHTKRKQKLAEKWSFLRNNMYKMMVQSKALPSNQKCFSCDMGNADVRCEQCGPLLMCQKCCTVIHSKLHYHHFPEIWQVQDNQHLLHTLYHYNVYRIIVLCPWSYHQLLSWSTTMNVPPNISVR